jgi:Fe-S oxidoreductase
MIRKFREGMVAAGFAPPGLKAATVRAIEIGSAMGVTLKTLTAQIKHAEEETGLKIPLDQEGVDYLLVLSAAEIRDYYEIFGAVARIFKEAGVSWTLASDAFEGTNSGIQIGSSDLAREILMRIVNAAERLKVKYVISPECGHAYTALRWEGPNLIGRPYQFEVIHLLDLLEQLRREGRLKLQGMESARLTFHDPCQIVRRGGVVEAPRNLLKSVASNFVEMTDHGVHNWCCGGGGGVSANPRATPLRLEVFTKKKQQLDELKVDTMVTACSNCRHMLEDGLEHYKMNVNVVGLTEIVASHLAPAAKKH